MKCFRVDEMLYQFAFILYYHSPYAPPPLAPPCEGGESPRRFSRRIGVQIFRFGRDWSR